jgi:succinate dehydrogenase / fumarate reductase cytochrome b subunit
MFFFTSTIGRKILMAITGQIMILFIIFHIAGNSTVFFHKLNSYVAALYTLPLFVWGGRIVLIAAFVVHVYYGTVIKLENQSSKPQSYAMSHYLHATFAGRNQFWTGVIIVFFLIYHLLQFTFQITNPRISADSHFDVLGRPDVSMMVIRNFQHVSICAAYFIALAFLGFHLLHGMQSSLQTWGLNNERTLPIFERLGTIASVILFFWYMSIPIAVVLGILKLN